VDSWYAILTALEDDPQAPPLTHVVFSPSFLSVVSWTEERLRERTEASLAAAARTGCRVVTLETNLKRDFGGAQLTSSALALGFSRMLIASGAMHGEIVPAGTHPALDHRFSTERTEIVHYGDANRLEKVARIARSPAAMETLNVCRYNRAKGDENCGKCEKCLRTMLELHVAGALERCPRFTGPLDPVLVARVRGRVTRRHQWLEILHALGDTPRDRQLAAAVRLVIGQSDLRRAAYELREASQDSNLAAVRPQLPEATKRASALAVIAHGYVHPDASPSRWPVREWLTRFARASESTAPQGTSLGSNRQLWTASGLAAFVVLWTTLSVSLEAVLDVLEGDDMDAGIAWEVAVLAAVAVAIWTIGVLAVRTRLARRDR
jgi:hypothetical protein